MRLIMTVVWAFLIIAALNYILTSMAGTAFNMTQTITYTIAAVLGIFLLDGVLAVTEKE